MEKEPSEAKIYAGAGRARAFLEMNSRAVEAEATFKCTWAPDSQLKVKGSQGNVAVGEVMTNGRISWNEEALKTAWGATVVSINQELADFKQA